MATDNIIIRITGESDLSNVNEDLQSLQDRERDIANEMRKQQSEYQKQVAAIQGTVKGREAQIAALDKLRDAQTKQQAGLEQELKKTKVSMDTFAKSMTNVNDTVAKGAVKTPMLRTQMMALKDELARMEMAGDNSSKAFVNLSVKAGKLQDQIGDTQQTIRILSSDTRGLDTAMGLGRGLAGSFTAATSAAALLGGENEALQKAFFKVQAVMSILNGVNDVALMLNKNSVVVVNLQTAVSESNTIARIKNLFATRLQNSATIIEAATTKGSTVARIAATATQWALNAAMYAFPIIAIVAGLAAIVAGIAFFVSGSKKAEEQQKALSKSVDDTTISIEKLQEKTKTELELLKAQGASKEVLRAAELKAVRKAYADALEEDKKQVLAYNAASNKQKDKLKEGVDAAHKLVVETGKAIREVKNRFNIEDVQATTDANKKKIEDQKNLTKKQLEDRKQAEQKAFDDERAFWIKYNEMLISEKTKTEQKRQDLINNFKKPIPIKEEAENDVKAYTDIIQHQLNMGLISYDDYLKKKKDYLIKSGKDLDGVNEEINKKDLQKIQDKKDKELEIINQSAQLVSEIGNGLFNAKKDQLAQEDADLERSYAARIEAAGDNKTLQLQLENELAAKKLEIKIKQAKVDKEQALFNIALSTAQAVIAALAMVPPNIPLSIFAGALGLTQAAFVMAKPLPKYAKGRKNGQGEFATVGELGPETMWIPDGASIIPHNRQMNFDTFKDFGIPTFDSTFMRGESIDYNKLGKAVADNIPAQKSVTVNVDKRGIQTIDGHSTTTYLNKKYSASWN